MLVGVVGASGMLGRDVINALESAGHRPVPVPHTDMDVTNLEAVESFIGKNGLEVVVNRAAFTDVDGCENQRDKAFLVNALGPRNLAIACHENKAALVHISSDYVFDGMSPRPYTEYDFPNPLSVYGWSKYAGEVNVRDLCPRHYIVRTQWLFGEHGRNFVKTILRLAQEREILTVVEDQIGSPTYTADLAAALVQLIKRPQYGTYHLTNSDTCTWRQFAEEILEIAGVKGVRVEPTTTESLARPARRPKNSVLENLNWRLSGHPALRSYREALTDFMTTVQDKEGSL